MRSRGASQTSELVAAYRAIHAAHHAEPILFDPYARAMIRPMWRLAARWRWLYALLQRVGYRLDGGVALCMARSRIAEDRLDELHAAGAAQWVLLGAGLDTFAWRRPECASLPQFEVDHPGDVPAVFAWLGVTYYLPRLAIEATLRDLATIAAPGSYLILDYRIPDQHLLPGERPLMARADQTFARWGEPVVSLFEPEEWGRLATAAGWRVVADHTRDDIVARFFRGHPARLAPVSTYRIAELTPAARDGTKR